MFHKRKSPPLAILLLATITLGSGIVNLYSVIGPSLTSRRHLLREAFPLEFIRLSRFLTLILGFALIVSSINIYKRKKRAWSLVSILAAGSVLFHLTKGLDYEEAFFSLLLLVALIRMRKSFTVRSGPPDLRSGLIRLGIVVSTALCYGSMGFWILERREFGIDFTLREALSRTAGYLFFVDSWELVPRTRYALWFLDSLHLITYVTLAYAVFSIFRPALYRFATQPHEQEEAQRLLEQHGRSSLDYFKVWPDKSLFFSSSRACFLAYGVGRNFAVVLGDPVGTESEIEEVLEQFRDLCRENDWGHAIHQTLPDFIPIYARLGYRKLKIGDDAIVELEKFRMEGKEMKKLRHAVNQLEKEGIRARIWEAPLPDDILHQAREVSDEWLEIPGRRERRFTLGLFEPGYIRTTPLYGAHAEDGKLLAFVNIIPSYCRGEATIDLMRHRLGAPNRIMDFLFIKLFAHARDQGYARFNLGMAPMAGFREHEESSLEERAVHYFMQQLNFIFSFSGLRLYKARFATRWEPRYAVYENVLDLPRLALALNKVCELR